MTPLDLPPPEPNLYRIADFDGNEIAVPVGEADDFPYFQIGQVEDIRAYYRDNGYVVVRGLLPHDLCDRAAALFAAEVKPFGGFIDRQASANPERHVFTEQGFVQNTILNIQSLDRRHSAGFRQGLALLTHESMQGAVSAILGGAGKLVQSMYFDGNPETWPHGFVINIGSSKPGRGARRCHPD